MLELSGPRFYGTHRVKILPQVVMNMAETEGEIECLGRGIDNLSRETEDIKRRTNGDLELGNTHLQGRSPGDGLNSITKHQ